jgi:hypothetical protein
VGSTVRIAYVSRIPQNKRELMAAKSEAKPGQLTGRVNGRIMLAKSKDGRVHGTFFKVYDSDKGLPDLPSATPGRLDEG